MARVNTYSFFVVLFEDEGVAAAVFRTTGSQSTKNSTPSQFEETPHAFTTTTVVPKNDDVSRSPNTTTSEDTAFFLLVCVMRIVPVSVSSVLLLLLLLLLLLFLLADPRSIVRDRRRRGCDMLYREQPFRLRYPRPIAWIFVSRNFRF